MEVVKIKAANMLCGSGDGYFKINNGSAYDGQSAWGKEECEDEIGW